MEHTKPIDLLKERLKEYEKAFQKSFESYQKGSITIQVHQTHKDNLQPLIFQYIQAVEILSNWI